MDWSDFPRTTLAVGHRLYRAARHDPWWFCACGGCRFDLTSPRGTCYLGTDAVSGLVESIGMEWATGRPMTRDFLEQRRVFTLGLPARTSLADLVSRKAIGFKVTNELSTMTPYAVPQQFADQFDGARRRQRRVFDGIRFRTRFDTDTSARGVALFGDQGLSATDSAEVKVVDDTMVDALLALGVVVDDPPGLVALDIAPDP